VRVWVSGASGFVGSVLVPRLAQDGHSVVAADREVDVSDAGVVDAAIAAAAPDAVVHLAARASVAESFGAAETVARVNYAGTLHVLRAVVRRAPRARVLVISSGEIYGGSDTPVPLDESAPLAPGSPYARSKAAADLLAEAFAARGLDVVRARSFNHTGAGQQEPYVAASFARQIAEMEAARREPVMHVGNLAAVRDFLDVRDVVDAYVRLLDRARAPAGAYNVASGVGRSIAELLETLIERSAVRPRVEVDAARFRPARPSIGDATRLRRATGWSPTIPFETTLAALLDDWRARVSAMP
jgi:GDP-4-dehydro-6-deoxy-D-mannose reductase